MLFSFIFLILLVLILFIQKTYIICWYLGFPKPQKRLIIDRDIHIAAQDGLSLSTDVYRPKGEGKYPVLILRTPYNKRNWSLFLPPLGFAFASQGYAVVIQDVRGKYKSTGSFIPYVNEAEDGLSTIKWAEAQDWSNGKIGLIGSSYMGSCAWLAAQSGRPSIKTLLPLFTTQSAYHSWIDRGVPYLKDMVFWMAAHGNDRRAKKWKHQEVDKAIKSSSADTCDQVLTGQPLSEFQEFLKHTSPDEFWTKRGIRKDAIQIPALLIGGWFDGFIQGAINDYSTVNNDSSLIMGPWEHDPLKKFSRVSPNSSGSFTPVFKTLLEWCERWLKENSQYTFPPVLCYIMRSGIWKTFSSWPPIESSRQKLYLTKEFNLETEQAKNDGSLNYSSDPSNPVPSIGSLSVYGNGWQGPQEQNSLMDRLDVLTFKTPPLDKDLTLAGPVKATLYVSSSAVDSDFLVKLVDIDPNGNAYYVMSGYLRMRYRDSLEHPKLMEPGKIYQIEIDLRSTAYTFFEGNALGVLIASTDFPRHALNGQTGENNESIMNSMIANQNIHVGPEYPSCIEIPCLEESLC